jgi:hypothetical protein
VLNTKQFEEKPNLKGFIDILMFGGGMTVCVFVVFAIICLALFWG